MYTCIQSGLAVQKLTLSREKIYRQKPHHREMLILDLATGSKILQYNITPPNQRGNAALPVINLTCTYVPIFAYVDLLHVLHVHVLVHII